MTPEEKRIAIAEACGWRFIRKEGSYFTRGIHGIPPHQEACERNEKPLPDYFNDLNPVHDVEMLLNDELYTEYTRVLEAPYAGPRGSGEWYEGYDKAIRAGAPERVEALLRVLDYAKAKYDTSKLLEIR